MQEQQDQQKLTIPSIPIFNLTPPQLKDYSIDLPNKNKHLKLINGQQQFTNQQAQLIHKYKPLIQKSQKTTIQSESTGQQLQQDPNNLTTCQKCNKSIQKSEISIHMSCHAAIILDNLLLGDKMSAQSNKELIQRNKVTHVVNAACQLPNYLEKYGLKYCKLQLFDQIDQDIVDDMEKAYQFIRDSHDQGGVVFVHCAVGKSRSVSVILIYLLKALGIGINEGLKMVKGKRPIAQPNFGYMKQLLEYEQKFLQQKSKNIVSNNSEQPKNTENL